MVRTPPALPRPSRPLRKEGVFRARMGLSQAPSKPVLRDAPPVSEGQQVSRPAHHKIYPRAPAVRHGGRQVRLSVLGRNVTTALAMAVTSILGGDISIAASVVVMTGIIAATYGRPLMDAMGVTDPIARGLGIGSAGQGYFPSLI